MNTAQHEPRPAYPLPVFSYRVLIGVEALAFSEVSGLSLDYEKVIYQHGFSYLTGPNIIRTRHHPVTLTLRRGLAARRSELWAWFSEPATRDLTIDLCDPSGAAVVRWKVDQALPLKLSAPALVAATNEVAIESLDLIAPTLSMEYL